MYSKHLENLISYSNETIYEGYWRLHNNKHKIVIIIDDNEKFAGVCTTADFKKFSPLAKSELAELTLNDVCNKNPQICGHGDNVYLQAAYIFSTNPDIFILPVIDNENNVIDICTYDQVFYKSRFKEKKLERMNYARPIFSAADLAKALNLKRISIIEFGVAGGNGLVNCEFHAKEIERLTGVKIDIYGFDTGEGLPDNSDVRNLPYMWFHKCWEMDLEKLKNRLTVSKLVIGDITETSKSFFMNYNPAPIGAMLVDVDYYTSTVPILDMFHEDSSFFLPRVYMYFDDITPEIEFIGENLAICEFNKKNNNIKISPEGYSHKEKCCHLFDHKDYSKPLRTLESARLPLI